MPRSCGRIENRAQPLFEIRRHSSRWRVGQLAAAEGRRNRAHPAGAGRNRAVLAATGPPPPRRSMLPRRQRNCRPIEPTMGKPPKGYANRQLQHPHQVVAALDMNQFVQQQGVPLRSVELDPSSPSASSRRGRRQPGTTSGGNRPGTARISGECRIESSPARRAASDCHSGGAGLA